MKRKKTLYFDAPDGISGDMTLGALIDLGADVRKIRHTLDTLVPNQYELIPQPFERKGVSGVNLDVIVPEDGQPLRNYADICAMIENSTIPQRAKSYALSIFSAIAQAEGAVHGIPKEQVVFHETGAMDSIVDVVGTAIAIDLLDAETFYCSEVHDGSGNIICRHGTIPVPVPAVVEMARDCAIPIVIEKDVNTEMITPTGYGILKGLGVRYAPKCSAQAEKIGIGFGKRETGRIGALRIGAVDN
jgi:uncharacterized protein (TIGR00299 family) protein